ncbi:protein adenylyltransferase SelO [Marinomonas epiphytica]
MQLEHHFYQLGGAFFSETRIHPLHQQRLVEYNLDLAQFLSIDFKCQKTLDILSGKQAAFKSLSMVYAGHQFGGFTPQLGDGRGVLLGELQGQDGLWYDLHMKGAGPTPYSRRGDGRAVLRSSIREYLASEAMHALGVPSSRALALFDSKEAVYRERPEMGAMLLRTARGHIRFGHFEYFYSQGKTQQLNELIDYTLQMYFPQCLSQPNPICAMLIEVVSRTAQLMARWQALGFQHGVMNTDNFSITGETIDYGPYGFMEGYDDNWICNHSDYEGRYRFNRQPGVGLWNLNCLLRCFSHRLERDDLVAILQTYEVTLQQTYEHLMLAKLGINDGQALDSLLPPLFEIMAAEKLDYSVFWRLLSNLEVDQFALLLDEVIDRERLLHWLKSYQKIRAIQGDWQTQQDSMLAVNPKYILRNYLAHQVIEAAERGDYLPFRRLLSVLKSPFDEHEMCEELAQRSPEWAESLEVSCSS